MKNIWTNTLKNIKGAFSKENRKENLKRLFILSILFLLIFAVPWFFGISNETVLGILFLILVFITWFMAGFTVFKSLFTIGAGFSLIIFIAKSYCDLPEILHISDNSLKGLLSFGFVYIVILFSRALTVEIWGDKKENKGMFKMIEEIYRGEKPFTIVSLYLSFIVLFLIQLFQVIVPIILGLCVYKQML